MINVELKPLLGKLNAYAKTSLEAAAGLCISRSNYEVTIEHLLLKLAEDSDRDFQIILAHYGVDAGRVQKGLQRAVEREKTGNQSKPVFSPLLIEWMQEAWLVSSVDFNLAQTRSGALIAALVLNPRRYGLADYYDELSAIVGDDLRQHFKDIVGGSKEDAEALQSAAPGASGASAAARGAPGGGNAALEKFTINFTAQARAGEIDPVFCRDREIRQAIDILGRRRKNNPIFVGEAGVGKTAVVEGLALKIAQGDVPDILKGVEILGLDMGLLQAGASVKGEFEQRLKSVIQEVKASPKPIIIFIDEAHTLIGAGGSAGGGDAANLLKPALARGELRTMAATTWSEYKKYFEKDPALARRFQLVKIEEPSPDEAVIIMRGLREKYENAHQVYVRDDAVVASAQLAARYISGRQLPDKSVDLLDTACARVKINISSKPERIEDLERRVKTLQRELSAISRDIETGIRADDGARAELEKGIAQLNDEHATLEVRWKKEKERVDTILELRVKISAAPELHGTDTQSLKKELADNERRLAEVQGKDPLLHYEVNPDAVSKVVADWTGIPVGNMVKDELAAIMSFGTHLKKRIKGQDHAIDAIDQRIRAAKAGLANQHAPIGVFLLVGPSGVGKTETGLGMADMLFGGERFVVTINMSEYQEKHTVSRLIGSPPGYVGYGEGGQLTEAVRQRPYSVVLLDEVEKADPEVLNLFYQVFDKGSLTDGEGREIDFKNTVILLTSNLGSDIITELSVSDPRPSADTIAEAVRPVLINHFKPALLARMEVVPYFTISKAAMSDIVKLKLNALGKRILTSQRIRFDYSEKVVEQVVSRCTEVDTGARNIDYIINRTLLPQISTEILNMLGEERVVSVLTVDINAAGAFDYKFV